MWLSDKGKTIVNIGFSKNAASSFWKIVKMLGCLGRVHGKTFSDGDTCRLPLSYVIIGLHSYFSFCIYRGAY